MTDSAQGPGNGKTRVAVLGCGMSSIAAMYSLTERPEDREKYEVTAYQLGWRVGGKGASGRNMELGGRIEEHGLHIWFGFYDNAFRVMREAYEELGRAPNTPLATFDDAFRGQDYVVLMDTYKNAWRTPWQYTFPDNLLEPGGTTDLPSIWGLMYYAISGLVLMFEAGLFGPHARCHHADPHEHEKTHWWDRVKVVCADIAKDIEDLALIPASMLLGVATSAFDCLSKTHRTMKHDVIRDVELGLIHVLERIRAWLWDAYGCHVDDDRARECLTLGDTTITAFIGILRDEVRTKGIFSIDDVELSAWLTKHGVNALSLTSPIVRALYDNIFAYENGDRTKPNAAAGTSLLWMLRMILTYKGHLMYKMNAGMGDTVFTPFYQVLENRGVNFKFFNCVTSLGLDATKSAVDTIDVVQQVDLTVAEYDPLVLVKDLPCWPSQPNWDQIRDGERFRAAGVNLEQIVTPIVGRQPTTLRRGTDFDIVILGLPLAALKDITRELYDNAAKPAWKDMIDHVATVQTQAYQVWSNQDLSAEGWPYGPAPVLGTYEELIDTYADMSHLIAVEDQPASLNVQSIAYFCGAMPDTATQDEADKLAYKNALDNLVKAMPALWGKLKDGNGNIQWDWLIDPRNLPGAARFDGQYVRANWTPTERYTLSLTGTTKYRLKADQSGYDNLFLAGDWTQNYFNSGCIEAATMSGMQASRAICGNPKRIVGEPPDIWEGGR